jgi:putative redox protein
MEAIVKWKGKMAFRGVSDSQVEIPLDSSVEHGGEGAGLRPMELIAIGVASCSAMDVISILQKKRQDVTDFEIKVHAERATEHPKVFTSMMVEYIVSGRNLDPAAVNRAVQLSVEKYCSVQAMLSKVVPIQHSVMIKELA